MGMPTEEELREALAVAQQMREQGQDPHHLAKALLNFHYQVKYLERVLHAAELFIHSGMAVAEHQRLRKAIQEARGAVERTGAQEPTRFGLE